MPAWSTTLDSLSVEAFETPRGRVEAARVGAGPTVLLVHGIPGSWRQAIPLAEGLTPGFEVVLPSRPGYGLTPVAAGRSYEEQADVYAAILDALGVDRCAIVGISGGGPSAYAFAARHPGRTYGLVLACAMVPHLMNVPKAMDFLRVPGLAEAMSPGFRALARLRLRRPGAFERHMHSTLTGEELARAEADRRIRDDIVRHVLGHQEAPAGVAGVRNDYAQVRRVRGQASWPTVTSPALVLHGDADTVVPLDHARFYAEMIPGSRLRVYENAGHLFLLTRREESTEDIRAFLASLT